jgi:hypothetical protein
VCVCVCAVHIMAVPRRFLTLHFPNNLLRYSLKDFRSFHLSILVLLVSGLFFTFPKSSISVVTFCLLTRVEETSWKTVTSKWIMLKRILKELDRIMWTGFKWSRIAQCFQIFSPRRNP